MERQRFHVLSGGRELKAACYWLELAGVKILLDCGASVDRDDNWTLPPLDRLAELGGVDVVFISHAHLDHVGGLPALLELYPHITIISTKATRELAIPMLNQLARQGKPYSLNSLCQVWQNWIATEELGCWQEFRRLMPGSLLRAGFWPAGHIPGAAMVLLEGEGERWLYTGDFSLKPTYLTEGARLPYDWRPDVVISESTYATKTLPDRQHITDIFMEDIVTTLRQGGTVLIPAFALGRSQEILLMLERCWQERQLPFEIFFDGLTVEVNQICDRLGIYSAVLAQQLPEGWELARPAVIVASSGMLLPGSSSCRLAARLKSNEKNAIYLVGYQAPETPGSYLLQAKAWSSQAFWHWDGTPGLVRARIETFPFSAHVQGPELKDWLLQLQPKQIYLVHGNYTEQIELAEILEEKGVRTELCEIE